MVSVATSATQIAAGGEVGQQSLLPAATKTGDLSNLTHLSAFIRRDHAYGASPDLGPGDFIHGDCLDFRPRFSVQKPNQFAAAPVLAAPGADREEHRQEIAAGSGQQIFLAWRVLRVAPFLQQSFLRQRRQSTGQHRRGDAQAFPELVETRQAAMGVTQDQDAPRIAQESQAARNRAGVIASIFDVHTI